MLLLASHGALLMEMNLVELVEQFGSNDRCREYLEHLRWKGWSGYPKGCAHNALSHDLKVRTS